MTDIATPAPPRPATRTRRRRRRLRLPRSLRTGLVFVHRWSSLVLGLLLLAVVLSGAVLLYEQEIDRLVHPSLHHATASDRPLTHQQALAVVRREAPGLKPNDVVDSHGVYLVYANDYMRHAYVDPGSGKLLGVDNPTDGVMGFIYNLHVCGLGCKGYAGYLPFLEKPAHVLGNEELTVGGLLLGVSGVLLFLLVITGLIVWWPGIKRFARGLRVRRGRGTYALNYDLHNVVGFAAIPFLAMWAITGMNFEFKQVSDVWYAVLPGQASPDPEFVSKPIKGRSVTMDQAAAIAQRTVPDGRLVSVSVPDRTAKDSTYYAYLARGNDTYDHGIYPGNVGVAIDRYSGKAAVTYPARPDPPLSEQIINDWFYPLHAGVFESGWWRTVWLVFGVTPLLLAVTGVTTWLIRRRKRRRKRPRPEPAPS